MGGWQTVIKLGRPRKEISFDGIVDGPSDFSQSISSTERAVKNSAGERFRRSFRRQNADFRVRMSPPVSDAIKNQLESLKAITDEPLSFFFADAWPIFSDRYTLDTATTFKLSSSPYTRLGKAYKTAGGTDTDIINISDVFDTYDVAGAQGGTDHFSGGSYDAVNRIVTLGSAPPGGVGSVVFANWTYKGALVFMRPFRPRHRAGLISAGTAQWDIALQLDGV